jgi:PAS domain-containing protein
MQGLFARQLAQATAPDGTVDMDQLAGLVDQAYADEARARRRLDRAMRLMNEELEEKNIEVAEQARLSVLRYIVSAAHPLAIANSSGVILIANKMAGTLLQQKPNELAGRMLSDMFALEGGFDGTHAIEYKHIPLILPDGSRRTLALHCSPARVSDDVYCVISFRDETEREQQLGSGLIVVKARR